MHIVITFQAMLKPTDMKSVQPTKDMLFAILGRSVASSMKQTVFSRLYRFHILTFVLAKS